MLSVNRIILVGRLGHSPSMRETKKGYPVANFSVATSRRVTVEQEGVGPVEKEETEWHRVIVWGKQAGVCLQYLGKGDPVYVEGMVRSRKYTAKDGSSRFAFEVHAEQVTFLGKKRNPETEGVTELELAAEAVVN